MIILYFLCTIVQNEIYCPNEVVWNNQHVQIGNNRSFLLECTYLPIIAGAATYEIHTHIRENTFTLDQTVRVPLKYYLHASRYLSDAHFCKSSGPVKKCSAYVIRNSYFVSILFCRCVIGVFIKMYGCDENSVVIF